MHDAFKDGSQQYVRTSTGSGEALGTVPSAPEGWRLVPIEPTDAMLDADWDVSMSEAHSNGGVASAAWRAMLEAAPQATFGNGHSGLGWYAHDTDYPEEGAMFLGAASPEVLPASPVPNVQDPSSAASDGGKHQ